MENTIQKFRQSSIVFEKPGILSENLKTLTSSNLSYRSIFFSEASHTFSTYQCLPEGVWDFFKFCLDLELIAKIKKDLVSTHSSFTLITQDLNKMKKIPHIPL